jgi:Resolvase, N terminal domain
LERLITVFGRRTKGDTMFSKPREPRPLIGYLRFAMGRQGLSGLGLEAQRDALERFAVAEGFRIIREYVEVETGKGANALERRPLLRMCASVCRQREVRPALRNDGARILIEQLT